MKKIIALVMLATSVSAYAEGRNYMVMLGFNPNGTGGSIGKIVWADSEIMACNIALQSEPGMFCWSISPQ